jgi:hypothetical protein
MKKAIQISMKIIKREGYSYFLKLIAITLNAIIFKRPCEIVILYGSRFGHLLTNTEYYLQNKFQLEEINKKIYYVIISKEIDSIELKEIIEKAYKIKIITGIQAMGLYCAGKILGWAITDIAPQSEPLTIPFKSKCAEYIKNRITSRPHVTMSLRNGGYSKNIQKGDDTTWRDTPEESLRSSIEKILDLGYDIYLVNLCLNTKKIVEYGVSDKSKISLKERWGLISNANFHIGTSTGLDLCAIISKVPTCNLNGFFGPSLNSPLYSDLVGFMLPMNMFYAPEGRFCGPMEKIQILKKIEAEYKESSIIHPAIVSQGYHYLPNSEQSVFDAISELMDYVGKPAEPTKDQELFWDVYPHEWVNCRFPSVVFHSKKNNTKLRISQNYLIK